MLVACAMAVALASFPATHVAAATAPKTESKESAKAPTVEEALEAGDLSGARKIAAEASQADTTPENLRTEAEVLERMDDLHGAIAAYKAYRASLPKDAKKKRGAVDDKIRDLEARSRGTVEDEPQSSHRKQLDEERADRLAAKQPKQRPKPAPAPEPKDEKIIRKWYFWVTLTAIVAGAAAITGIAIKAATKDQPDALSLERDPSPTGPTLFRF